MDEFALFEKALETADAAQRERLLDEACAGNPALRQRLETLLANAQRSFDLLEQGPSGRSVFAEQPAPEAAGQMIGPYRLVRQLGAGGMGTVWLAEQLRPIVRSVALKLIQPNLNSRQILARFETERQALAILNHPNIAKVLDAGADPWGRPYFVMELVDGPSITTYCNAQRLTLRERLKLFVPVCQAVQHAHQKGVIHRDLKPSNVLVATVDGQPAPKVIDFGLAKALAEPLTDQSFTSRVEQILGTLEYMSPEQAQFDRRDIDTRSDVYSLGVMLYELITGKLPLPGKGLGDDSILEALRRIREDDPEPASQKLAQADNLPSLAAERDVEPARLTRQVKGEIDWILLKALKKDRSGRYDAAQALADDLESYLDGQPVKAGPDSAAYRIRKLVRKHKTWFAAGVTFVALLLAATTVSSSLAWALYQANTAAEMARIGESRERKRAEENFDTTVDFVKKYGRTRLSESGLDSATFALLELARADYRQRLALEPIDLKSLDALASVASLAAEAYRKAGTKQESIDAAREAVEATRRQFAIAQDAPTEIKLAHRLEYLSIVDAGPESAARDAEAKEIRQRRHGQKGEDDGLAFSLFLSHYNEAVDLSNSDRTAPALAAVEKSLEYVEIVRPTHSGDDLTQSKIENGYALKADLLYRLGKAEEAQPLLTDEVGRLRHFIAEHPDCMHCRGALAMALNKLFFHAEGSGVAQARDELDARRSIVERRLRETAWQDAVFPLVESQFNVGFALCAEENYAAARENLLQAEHLCRLWPSDDTMPRNVQFRRAEVVKWLAEAELQLARFEDALGHQSAGIEYYGKLAPGDPGDLNLVRDSALLRFTMEKPLTRLGRREEGIASLLHSAGEFQQLAARDVQRATHNDFGLHWKPICLYFSAAAYARAHWRLTMLAGENPGRVDPRVADTRSKALANLRTALASGFDNQVAELIDLKRIDSLVQDEDWTALRDDPELLKLVASPPPE